MFEDSFNEENSIIEQFDVEEKDNYDLFIENKCPINLSANNYIKLKYSFGGKKFKINSNRFESSKISNTFNIKAFAIILSLFYSISSYYLLATFVIYHDIKLLIYFIIVFILSSIFQVFVVPKPIKYKSKYDFEEIINKILNSYVIFQITDNKKEKKVMYQAKYTIDITGNIYIPTDVGYAKIKQVQLFAKDDLEKLKKDFEKIYKSSNIDYKLFYKNKEIKIDSSIVYSLYSGTDSHSINNCTSFLSLFLLQWLNAICFNLSQSKKCINISFAKLITNNLTNSPSKFTVHGENYKIEQYIVNPIEINKKFNEDFEEYQKNKKEKKRNTEILSNFKNGKNFNIKVKRVYNKVFP